MIVVMVMNMNMNVVGRKLEEEWTYEGEVNIVPNFRKYQMF